jgi:Ca2+-binding RTX toxin-like protein
VYTGDGTSEHVAIDKEPVNDANGTTVGALYSVQDTRSGGVARGTGACAAHPNFDVSCPFGSATLRVSLGGGSDTFESRDQTLGKPFSCLAQQAVAPIALDGGPGRDIVAGSRLADTLAGGSGNDALAGWEGDDRLTGGAGVDLLEGHDGNDVAEGGAGNDVIHLNANPLDRESCFRASGKSYRDVGRGGPGNDAISATRGRNRIEGGSGNDELVGGKGTGSDKILGGSGRDRIWSRDGRRDHVNCGSGRDLVQASDRKDRVVGCEKRFLRPR